MPPSPFYAPITKPEIPLFPPLCSGSCELAIFPRNTRHRLVYLIIVLGFADIVDNHIQLVQGGFVDQQPKRYSSSEICALVKVSKNTLLKWLEQGFIAPPAERTVYQFLWSEENLQNIRTYVERRTR